MDGESVAQPLTVRMDPRVKAPLADLEAQHVLSTRLGDAMRRAAEGGRLAQASTAEAER